MVTRQLERGRSGSLPFEEQVDIVGGHVGGV
jgi:hypothetical protein